MQRKPIKRRDFFKNFFFNMNIMKEEAKGNRHFKLTDLWKFNEQMFKKLKFRLQDGVYTNENPDEITALTLKDQEIIICKKNSIEEQIFRFFQEGINVGEIAELIVPEDNLKIENKFQYVRNFLLSLVRQNICVPANDMPFEEEDSNKGEEK